MLNTTSTSSFVKSMSCISSWKRALREKPLMISRLERVPDPSRSSSTHMDRNSAACRLNSDSLSARIACASSSAALSEDSTTIDKMTFKIIKFVVKKTMAKNTAVTGSSSMTGIDTRPQLSPVTSCCVKVNNDAQVDSKARGHRGQPSYAPVLAMRWFTGCNTCTATTDKSSNVLDKSNKPQPTTRSVAKSPLTIEASCGKRRSMRPLRARRSKRSVRKKPKEKETWATASTMIMAYSRSTMNKSRIFQGSKKKSRRKR
mmetsp:Transcript_82204/g.237559  ORF Transcript_82204/g.237559 Transcript_82204/m.237559 type:complete len:259 (+) Transcript_82204:751-1527(+)